MKNVSFRIGDIWCYIEQVWLRPEIALSRREQKRGVSGSLSDICRRCSNCKLIEYQKQPFVMIGIMQT